jgi:hypothetical protein
LPRRQRYAFTADLVFNIFWMILQIAPAYLVSLEI